MCHWYQAVPGRFQRAKPTSLGLNPDRRAGPSIRGCQPGLGCRRIRWCIASNKVGCAASRPRTGGVPALCRHRRGSCASTGWRFAGERDSPRMGRVPQKCVGLKPPRLQSGYSRYLRRPGSWRPSHPRPRATTARKTRPRGQSRPGSRWGNQSQLRRVARRRPGLSECPRSRRGPASVLRD